MPVIHNRNRRAFNAPKFQLGDLPQRSLQPMQAVARDSLGTTSYAVQGAGHASMQIGGVTGFGSVQQQQLVGSANQNGIIASHSATQVTPHLYLGGQGDASSASLLRKLKIRRILNVAGECMPHSHPSDSENQAEMSQIETMHIELKDHSDENISTHFSDALKFIHEAISQKEAVLVHCRFGVSRSATIVIAYLMQYGTKESPKPSPMSYETSFDFVKARRPQVSPNLGFVLALHQLDEENSERRGHQQIALVC